jgi:peptidoglycan hydrolase CwlO-like protein
MYFLLFFLCFINIVNPFLIIKNNFYSHKKLFNIIREEYTDDTRLTILKKQRIADKIMKLSKEIDEIYEWMELETKIKEIKQKVKELEKDYEEMMKCL